MTESKRNEIISRWRAGSSIRQIARELGLARNTVRRVLAQIEARRAGAPDGSPTRWRPSRFDPSEPVIRELLGRYPDLTAVRLLEELRQRGFTGGYTVVRQRLRNCFKNRVGCSEPLENKRFFVGARSSDGDFSRNPWFSAEKQRKDALDGSESRSLRDAPRRRAFDFP
jgi:transposase